MNSKALQLHIRFPADFFGDVSRMCTTCGLILFFFCNLILKFFFCKQSTTAVLLCNGQINYHKEAYISSIHYLRSLGQYPFKQQLQNCMTRKCVL